MTYDEALEQSKKMPHCTDMRIVIVQGVEGNENSYYPDYRWNSGGMSMIRNEYTISSRDAFETHYFGRHGLSKLEERHIKQKENLRNLNKTKRY